MRQRLQRVSNSWERCLYEATLEQVDFSVGYVEAFGMCKIVLILE